MTDHTDLLNYLVVKYGLTSYLEIGVQNPKNNFDKINVTLKHGVDPNPRARATHCMTSDEFFQIVDLSCNTERICCCNYDLIFIDGLHHADQVERDFENSLKCLSPNGFIVLHDTCPESEHLTHVPRDKRGRWLGDVYKFVIHLNRYEAIDFCTLDFDNGCTVVWRNLTMNSCKDYINSLEPIGWNTYIGTTCCKHLMRIVTMEEFQFRALLGL